MLNRDAMLSYLRDGRPVIAPSMLKCDFGNLHREMEMLDAAGAPLMHLDVMDAHFVPNLSYGPMVIEKMRPLTSTPFDAHLMVTDPAQFLDEYIKAGCEAITFHLEAVPDPTELLREIRSRNVVAGLAINPDTPFSAAEPFLPECDLFLVMSVHPGFGGQKFIPDVLSKVSQARAAGGPDLIISIDGGVGKSTIAACARAGTDVFVAGSSVFDEPDYSAAVADLHQIALSARSSC
ncbi:MAG: ribulose-phosphate 3-epimerase [Planctomycetaceae bacterium]|nr:ribulose-phosphate 3-epimerase [Planctomycetaceae bacterium]